jgi:hypothetical protein
MSTLNHSSEVTIQSAVKDDPSVTYRFGAMGPAVRSNFVRYLKAQAWAELDSQRTLLDAGRFQRVEAGLFQQMASKQYEWLGPVHLSIDGTRPAVITEAVARLQVYHPEANEITVEKIVNVVGWDRLLGLLALADGPAPNGQAPAAKPATGATELTTKESSATFSDASPEQTREPSTK